MTFRAILSKLASLGWPWHPTSKTFTLGNDMRVRARASRFKNFSSFQQVLLRILSVIFWPIGALFESLRLEKTKREHVEAGQTSQRAYRWYRAYWAALKNNVPPYDYYIYRLWDPKNKPNLNAYVYSHERLGLMLSLNTPDYLLGEDPIQDKLAFANFCKAENIPYPETLWHSGQKSDLNLPEHEDLWIKPQIGAHGSENMLVKHTSPNTYHFRGKTLDKAQLHNSLQDFEIHKNYLLQHRLKNSGELSKFSNGGLVVIRVVSGKDRHDKVSAVAATIQFPFGDDLTSSRGIIAAVDITNGRVDHFRSPDPVFSPMDKHPDTNAIFTPFIIPHWELAVQHITTLHLAVKGYAFIGWDVAITPNGPVILEGNSSWNAQQHQETCPDPVPLGQTSFLEIAQTYWS